MRSGFAAQHLLHESARWRSRLRPCDTIVQAARGFMNHLNSKLLVSFAAIWAVLSNYASGQMMRQPYIPMPRADMNPHPLLASEDQWIYSIVDRWPSSQRRAWQLLDPRFRAWVSHLVWTRKNAGHPSAIADLQEPPFQ